ncbi:MAG: hypothetical protein HN742_30305 [Lentisphaerae bacterium]|nr:hypothetical protein [Lentisphaerota bacterium]MBT5610194.1 hypothetical protein [Lentisphaerota bacterium]MBT7057073.1 hypothetical protein [Lentisphaerota bacterium]MBT7846204.1 hypothetical protein [Lentisphaerota bacterium]
MTAFWRAVVLDRLVCVRTRRGTAALQGKPVPTGPALALSGLGRFCGPFCAALGLFLVGCSKAPQRRGPARAEWAAYSYELQTLRGQGDFNMSFKLTPLTRSVTCRAVVNCRDPETYYFVELGEKEAWIGLVECGIERRLGITGEVHLNKGVAHEVVIKRRKHALLAVLDGRVVAQACDDTLVGGQVGVGALRSSAKAADLRVQPVADLDFADDFMRAEGELGRWKTVAGQWEIEGRSNPSLSANAYYVVGKGRGDAVCTVGDWFWDSFHAEAACRPLENAPFGVVLCYRGRDSHFLVVCRPGGATPVVQLVRRRGGEEAVLAEKAWPIELSQWVQLGVELSNGSVSVALDGLPVLTARDPGLSHGLFGLYTRDATEGTCFDDVRVRRFRSFMDDFESDCVGRWDCLGGAWQRVRGGQPGSAGVWALGVSCEGLATAVAGDRGWRNYTLSAAVGEPGPGRAGLLFCYLDSGNHYACLWYRERDVLITELTRTADGVVTIIGRSEVVQSAGSEWLRPSVCVNDGHLMMRMADETVLEAFDTTFERGRVGLLADGCNSVAFDEVRVRFNPSPAPLLPAEVAFAHEQSMSTWAGAGCDWTTCADMGSDGAGRTFRWHRAHFHGDVGMMLLAPSLQGEKQRVTLVIGAETTAPTDGICLEVERVSDRWQSTLSGPSGVLQGHVLTGQSRLRSVSVRWSGRFVTAAINGQEIARQPVDAVDGARIGFSVIGGTPAWDDIRVFTNNVYSELFREAPTDWRVAGGVWEVTNRWECDDRWSFFSGCSEALAAVWNKQCFAGDLVVEFYAGIKMNSDRGDAYQYASDINVTICGDGQDLTSGYSFLFGGWDDTATAIVRQDKVMARTGKVVIPREKGIHRHWFYVRVTKRGGELSFSVDGRLVHTYTDPEPLPDGQVAIWTHNNGLMVARVRVSHEGVTPAAAIAREPGRGTRCIYDVLPRLPEP